MNNNNQNPNMNNNYPNANNSNRNINNNQNPNMNNNNQNMNNSNRNMNNNTNQNMNNNTNRNINNNTNPNMNNNLNPNMNNLNNNPNMNNKTNPNINRNITPNNNLNNNPNSNPNINNIFDNTRNNPDSKNRSNRNINPNNNPNSNHNINNIFDNTGNNPDSEKNKNPNFPKKNSNRNIKPNNNLNNPNSNHDINKIFDHTGNIDSEKNKTRKFRKKNSKKNILKSLSEKSIKSNQDRLEQTANPLLVPKKAKQSPKDKIKKIRPLKKESTVDLGIEVKDLDHEKIIRSKDSNFSGITYEPTNEKFYKKMKIRDMKNKNLKNKEDLKIIEAFLKSNKLGKFCHYVLADEMTGEFILKFNENKKFSGIKKFKIQNLNHMDTKKLQNFKNSERNKNFDLFVKMKDFEDENFFNNFYIQEISDNAIIPEEIFIFKYADNIVYEIKKKNLKNNLKSKNQFIEILYFLNDKVYKKNKIKRQNIFTKNGDKIMSYILIDKKKPKTERKKKINSPSPKKDSKKTSLTPIKSPKKGKFKKRLTPIKNSYPDENKYIKEKNFYHNLCKRKLKDGEKLESIKKKLFNKKSQSLPKNNYYDNKMNFYVKMYKKIENKNFNNTGLRFKARNSARDYKDFNNNNFSQTEKLKNYNNNFNRNQEFRNYNKNNFIPNDDLNYKEKCYKKNCSKNFDLNYRQKNNYERKNSNKNFDKNYRQNFNNNFDNKLDNNILMKTDQIGNYYDKNGKTRKLRKIQSMRNITPPPRIGNKMFRCQFCGICGNYFHRNCFRKLKEGSN